MENESPGAPLPPLDLESQKELPLYSRVYAQVRDAILEGKLEPGTRLPSTRTLSHDLDLSRNTVLKAFDQLLVEGYVECRIGDGTYVSSAFARTPRHGVPDPNVPRTPAARAISVRARRMTHAEPHRIGMLGEDPVSQPNLGLFPMDTWNRLSSRSQRRAGRSLLLAGDPLGYAPLRRSLANYLTSARGMQVEPEQVMILPSRRHALDVMTRLLLDPGEMVLIEDPSDPGVRSVLLSSGAELHPLPVDHRGASLEVRDLPRARVAYVTPAHQNPLGPTLTLERRLRLLEWAERHGAWILEEDRDCDLRHRGRPLQALQGIDPHRRVLQVGCFANTLFPALRIAWLIAPRDLVDLAREARIVTENHCSELVQATLHEFMEGGHYASHVRRLRTFHRERRRRISELVDRHLGDDLQLEPGEAGTHVVGWLPVDVEDLLVAREARASELAVRALSSYYLKKPIRGGLVVGFGTPDDDTLEAKFESLGQLVKASIASQREAQRSSRERSIRLGTNGHSVAPG